MPKTTKTDLEQRLTEKEEELNKYRQWLMESDEKYNKLVQEKEKQFKLLPEYSEMKHRIERLELIQKNNEDTIARKKEKEERLRDKIQELLVENEKLKDNSENQTPDTRELQDQIEKLLAENERLLTENKQLKDTVKKQHNPYGAGRKPISHEKIAQVEILIKQGKKEKEICKTAGIARATYYRIKKNLL